ncbi:hypothetical protein VD0002_g4164 [Verticillium dahliae]|uniref:HMA domain-containing protein n=1 Tax=Verticillium dahliae TaxID=27337 RepID=A0AA44WKJ4_VERDA|nr:hypothetical protein BJF96_g3387 [Verticillium dahliae]PNH64546.1 hypothetical protein VD0002_g4164 [Verticillium dahliae]
MGSGCCSGDNTASREDPSPAAAAANTGCCGTTNTGPVANADKSCSSSLTSEVGEKDNGCEEGGSCCGDKFTKPNPDACQDDCCSDPKETSLDKKASDICKDGCCSVEPKEAGPVQPAPDACKDACCSDLKETILDKMAPSGCKDGCCSDPKETSLVETVPSGCKDNCCSFEPKEVVPVKTAPDACKDGCCGDQPKNNNISEETAKSCEDACCADENGARSTEEPAASCSGGCCGDKVQANTCESQTKASAGCCGGEKDACGNENRSPSISSDATTCCEGEEKCDEKCIWAVAAMECEKACDEDADHNEAEGHHHAHDKDGQHLNSACTSHLQSAMSRYEAYIEQARCICRSILNSGLTQTSCCAARRAAAPQARNKVTCSSGVSTSKTSRTLRQESQCGSKTDGLPIATAKVKESSCCTSQKQKANAPTVAVRAAPPDLRGSREKQKDLEECSGIEMVAVGVNGMTCSGCSDKLTRILKATPGVSEVRVNFVMSVADFSVDLSVNKATDVIKAAEGSTGFQITRLAGGDFHLDVLASGLAARALIDEPTDGIMDAMILDKKTVRLSYDPGFIGARDLFDKIHDRTEGLAPPQADPSLASGRKRLLDQLLKTCVAAILTIPVVVLAWGDNLVDDKTRAYVSIVLATLVQLIAVPEFYKPALSALVFSHVLEMDMLVVISITAAYLYSIVAFSFRMANKPLETTEFFETSTLLITLILLGRLIATYARVKAVGAVSMRSLQSSNAVLVEEGKDREIDARLLQYGDIFKIPPHSRVVTDGFVLSGHSEVDESMLTGESIPVPKQSGDYVIAGTVNGDGVITARLTRLPGKNTVTDIAEMVEEATNSKPKIQDLANKVASWFVPVVSAIAVLVVIIWVVVGLRVRNEKTGKAVADAITYAVAVLAVSCPCALGLAVPMVLVIAGGIAARGGIIIKSADCTESARKCTDVIFDKTGTITEGDLDVVAEEIFGGANEEEALALAKALVAGGKHPVSAATERHLESRAVQSLAAVIDVRVVPGAGVETRFNGSVLRAGNSRWTETETLPAVKKLEDQGLTTLVVTRDSTPLVVFGLRTQLRPEAQRVIAALQARNITVHLVSGDQARAVQSVAEAVGIPADKVAAEKTPSEKRDYVAAVMEDKRKYVIFCGDGTNDAVAVAQAHVGAQMGGALSSSDVTQGAADVILLAGLDGIPFLLDVSQASFNRMVFNFAWSAVYNVLAILLAAGAFVRIRIEPAYAGLGEIVSVLPVILAALSMLLLNIRGKHQQ